LKSSVKPGFQIVRKIWVPNVIPSIIYLFILVWKWNKRIGI
jgi:hypothetical protein